MIRPVDTIDLASAYARFLAEASGGVFDPPPAGQWSAELVVAHVATNDRILAAVTSELLAGGRPSYDNEPATLEANLRAAADAAGGLPDLIEVARAESENVLRLVAALEPAQAETPVHFRAMDAGVLTVDRHLPWAQVLDIHTHRHLPSHIEQLAALRPGSQ